MYLALGKSLRSSRITRRTKLTLIRPVVLYGHETRTMFNGNIRAIRVSEQKVLRTIYAGVQTEDGVWRR